MAKRRRIRRLPRAERARILAEAQAKDLTADQVAKRYGVSKWTYYGWRKWATRLRSSQARAVGGPASEPFSAGVLREEIRAILPGILREEIANALADLLGKRAR